MMLGCIVAVGLGTLVTQFAFALPVACTVSQSVLLVWLMLVIVVLGMTAVNAS
jgi:hypothetical protein